MPFSVSVSVYDTWQNPVRVSLPREGECVRELGLRESLFKRVQRGCIHNANTKIVPLRYSPCVVGVFNNITGGTNCLVFKWVSSGVPKRFLKAGGWHCYERMGDAVHERQSVLSSAVTQGVPAKVLEQGCGTHSSLSPGISMEPIHSGCVPECSNSKPGMTIHPSQKHHFHLVLSTIDVIKSTMYT